ncbi:fungal-specific transcription factor domain-containing protein [Terfezia claveryi]|nr:fungal-specific transcription factor domain-containing protein [Terfezia claveryi]
MARGQNLKRPAVGAPGEGSTSGGRNAPIMGVGGVGIKADPASPPPMANPNINPPNLTATSTTTAKRIGQSSLALKTRRYIDININDVRNERARGKWTEEDDRMWKRTKPYECEICGERGSTRYNIENRHKVNRHSPQKVIPCPDCKLMFTRKDNLIKHQKKAHPDKFQSQPQTPPSDAPPPPKTRQRRTAEPKVSAPGVVPHVGPTGIQGQAYGIDDLAGAFKLLPVAEDLPSRQIQGLMAYYNPDKLPFLPPSLLTHYADYYFAPTAFHPHFPLIHKPTFDPSSVLASFLRAICCVGNIYDPTNRTMGKQLWESGWIVLERWIERGSEQDDINEGSLAQLFKEEEIEDKKAHREGRLCVLQAFILFEFYGLFSQDREAEKKARVLHFRCTEIAREHGYLKEMQLPQNYDELPLQQQWELFIECESRKRTAYSLYILDCNLSLLFNTPRLLRLQELKFLSLPCDDELFEAPTAQEWDAVRRKHDPRPFLLLDGSGVYVNSRKEKILFGAIYKKLIQGGGRVEEEYIDTGANTELNDYAAYLMVIGVIMEILALTQRVAEEEEEPNSRTGRGGKTVVIFGQDKAQEIERLRRALDTVGKLPRFSYVLELEKQLPYDLLRVSLDMEGAFDENVKMAAPIPLQLQGCAKSFYVAWHLAHIMLVIPDRMCLRNEETPLDMHTSFAHILLETKDRLEKVSRFSPPPGPQGNIDGANAAASSWGLGQGHMLFSQVFVSKIAPHLFAILRFTGKPEGYAFDMWDAEFPTVLGMVFKALVVVWELIVRVGREEEERRNVTQPIPPPLLGPFTQNTGGQPMDVFGSAWVNPMHSSAEWMYSGMGSNYSDTGYFPWNPNTTLHPNQYNQHHHQEQQDVKPNILTLQAQELQQQYQQQRRTKSPGENFLQEILEFVKYHEMLDGDTEMSTGSGKELLEWRFLRWMRQVFDEIDGWDVGRAVVRVMDTQLMNEDEEV